MSEIETTPAPPAKAVLHLHYRTSDGEIVGHENTEVPVPQSGCDLLSVEIDHGQPLHIDPAAMKIANGVLVEKSAAEKTVALAPTATDVSRVVIVQLQATDAWMMPDRPVSDDDRAQWVAYRKGLRELSKGDPAPSPAAMIAAFPERPDGFDAIGHLRARLAGKDQS
jgi:hypothetical protein